MESRFISFLELYILSIFVSLRELKMVNVNLSQSCFVQLLSVKTKLFENTRVHIHGKFRPKMSSYLRVVAPESQIKSIKVIKFLHI